jgi:hypothetical protein
LKGKWIGTPRNSTVVGGEMGGTLAWLWRRWSLPAGIIAAAPNDDDGVGRLFDLTAFMALPQFPMKVEWMNEWIVELVWVWQTSFRE